VDKLIYFYEEMDSHLFQVVGEEGRVIDKVDTLAAEGLNYRLKKAGVDVRWVDRSPSKERKHVRQLVSDYSNHCVGCSAGV
jgi:hypothetical protein